MAVIAGNCRQRFGRRLWVLVILPLVGVQPSPLRAQLETAGTMVPAEILSALDFDTGRTAPGSSRGSAYLSWGSPYDNPFADSSHAFSVPLNADDLRLLFSVDRTNPARSPFEGSKAEHEAMSLELGLQYPSHGGLIHELSVEGGFSQRQRDPIPFTQPLSERAGLGSTLKKGLAFRLAQEWRHESSIETAVVRSGLSFGLEGSDPSKALSGGDQIVSWLGQAQWSHRVGDGTALLTLRGEAQLTPDPLLRFTNLVDDEEEQNPLRDYRKGSLVRDNGVLLSIEPRFPLFDPGFRIPGSTRAERMVQLAPFFDYGRLWNDGEGMDGLEIARIGLGITWDPSPHTSVRFYVAHELSDPPEDERLSESGVFLRMQFRLN